MSTTFLVVSIIGALLTWNAHRPIRRGPLAPPAFFAGWLVSELPLHHIGWQVVATAFFIGAGALDHFTGWLGLAVSIGSWVGMLRLIPAAEEAGRVYEAALLDALGSELDDDRASAPLLPDREPAFRLNPFSFSHPDVIVERDIAYMPDDHERHRLDIYRPRTPVKNAPVLLQIHGGGWVIGNKREQALPLMIHLARRGWICVTTNYRLSPKATFPDHIVDVKSALKWVRENIADYGGDPEFVAVTGGSAGGHLSALLALTPNDPAFQPGFEDFDSHVEACVPFYGAYDWTNAYGLQKNELTGFIESRVMKKSCAENLEDFRNASPMHRIHPDAPPFFVIHGSNDGLIAVEEGRAFARRLHEISKNPVAYAELPGAQHAFEVFHSLRTDYTVAAVTRFLEWARRDFVRKRNSGQA